MLSCCTRGRVGEGALPSNSQKARTPLLTPHLPRAPLPWLLRCMMHFRNGKEEASVPRSAILDEEVLRDLSKAAIGEQRMAVQEASGGPFGAIVADLGGRVLVGAHNTVPSAPDSTGHAEINAIRAACRLSRSHDLSKYVLVSTSEPCSMCLGAIKWAKLAGLLLDWGWKYCTGVRVCRRRRTHGAWWQALLCRVPKRA